MKRRPLLPAVIFAALLFVTQFGFSAGFALYEGSARGNALGGLTGQADDPAALFYNPAGITNLEGLHFMGGVTLIAPFADVATINAFDGTIKESKYESNVFTPPHLYYTQQLSEKLWWGLAVFSRFGLGSEFKSDWPGRYNSSDANIETLSVNPNIAWKVNDKLSLALGVSAMWIDVELVQSIDATRFFGAPYNNPSTSALDATQTISGDSYGYGFNVAAHYKVNQKWSVGLTYNSRVEQDIDDGVARFQKPATPVPDTFFVDANVAADPIDLPEMVFLGANYQVRDDLAIGFGAIYTGWSSLDQLVFNYETPIIVVPGFNVVVDRVVRPLNWKDVWRYNVGIEHKVRENFNFMWGFILDDSPLRNETVSYLLPANDRFLVDTGIRCKLSNWVLDASFQYLTIRSRDIDSRQFEDGVLQSRVRSGGAILAGVSLSRKF